MTQRQRLDHVTIAIRDASKALECSTTDPGLP